MTHRSFAEAVLSAESLSHDSFPAPHVTALEYIRNVLRKPYGRGYAGQWWQGMQRRRDGFVHRMQRMRENDGFHFFSSDDHEYHEPKATDYRHQWVGEQDVRVEVPKPWRRLTEKPAQPGRERRARLRAERSAA